MVTAENGSALLHGAYGFIRRVRKGGERERERERAAACRRWGPDDVFVTTAVWSGRAHTRPTSSNNTMIPALCIRSDTCHDATLTDWFFLKCYIVTFWSRNVFGSRKPVISLLNLRQPGDPLVVVLFFLSLKTSIWLNFQQQQHTFSPISLHLFTYHFLCGDLGLGVVNKSQL